MLTRFPYKENNRWIVRSWNEDKSIDEYKSFRTFICAVIKYQSLIKKYTGEKNGMLK